MKNLRSVFRILLGSFVLFLLVSCAENTPIRPKADKMVIKTKTEKNYRLSNRGKYLYSILLDRSTGAFVTETKQNIAYNKVKYEMIHIYSQGGLFPSFSPNKIVEHKDSLFRDKTFDSIKTTGKVLVNTNFDKKEFLKIAKKALKKLDEKYANTPFSIDLKMPTTMNVEYGTATILIHHKPSLQLNKMLFFVNDSAMYADLISSTDESLILRKETYRIGLPTGKNRLKVLLSSKEGDKDEKQTLVENLFKGVPTFHIVAIGINEFPQWRIDSRLTNAVNDANYIKKTLQEKSGKLFNGRLKIQPYVLDYKNTTKANITKLIEEIRKNVKPNDYFLLYVASHGIIKDKKYYFAPSDFSYKKRYWEMKNGFKENQISEYLINIPSIFRIAILDTCYAGQEIESIKEQLRELPFSKKDGISVLTATKSTQTASDNYKGHGLFTYILGEGLNGKADYNRDGVVDSIEIAQYVELNVGRISRSETSMAQDAMVLPNPKQTYNKRFELTLLDKKKFTTFRPNIFTPRESQLYIEAIQKSDVGMMNGLIINNTRHKSSEEKESVDIEKISEQGLTEKLMALGSVDINLLFRVNSDSLNKKEIEKLRKVAKVLKENALKNKRIFIEGHSDADGDELSNMDLSQKRAESVALLLKEQFNIEGKRLTALGFGENYPIANNSTSAGKRQNRRVTIFIYD